MIHVLLLLTLAGAVGDGVADDTAAMQAAVAAAAAAGDVVYCPPGKYKLTAPLVLAPAGYSVTTGIVGAGSDSTRIQWYGGDTAAIALDGRTRGLRLMDFKLENMGVRAGIGVRFGGDVIGTNHSRGTIERVWVSGFNEGIAIGDDQRHAASEMTFRQLLLYACNYGVVIRDQQSVNLRFTDIGATFNAAAGLLAFAGSGLHVQGGSVGHQPADFDIRALAQRWTVEKVASEGSGRFLTYGSDAGGDGNYHANGAIRDNRVNNCTASDQRAIRLHAGGTFVIEGNDLWSGHLSYRTSSPGGGARGVTTILLTANHVYGPILLENEGEDASAIIRLTAIGNLGGSGGVYSLWPDQNGAALP